MREITVYTIGSRRQRVAGDRLQITQAKMRGQLGFRPMDSVVPLTTIEYTVSDLPIHTVCDADTENISHFAVESELWDKLTCAVRGELDAANRASDRYRRTMTEALDLLDGFRASARWRRLLRAWRNEL